jgi:hypothetical protein
VVQFFFTKRSLQFSKITNKSSRNSLSLPPLALLCFSALQPARCSGRPRHLLLPSSTRCHPFGSFSSRVPPPCSFPFSLLSLHDSTTHQFLASVSVPPDGIPSISSLRPPTRRSPSTPRQMSPPLSRRPTGVGRAQRPGDRFPLGACLAAAAPPQPHRNGLPTEAQPQQPPSFEHHHSPFVGPASPGSLAAQVSHPIYKNINRAIIYAPGSSHRLSRYHNTCHE